MIITVGLSFTCFLVGYQNYLVSKLGNFSINNIAKNDNELHLILSPSLNTKTYEVSVTNQEDKEIFKTESDSSAISLNNLVANYGNKLEKSNNIYEYIWEDASFVNNETYQLKLEYLEQMIHSETIQTK